MHCAPTDASGTIVDQDRAGRAATMAATGDQPIGGRNGEDGRREGADAASKDGNAPGTANAPGMWTVVRMPTDDPASLW